MKTEYFKAIFNNTPVSLVLIGKNHEVLAFNKAISEVLFKYFQREIKEGDFYYPDFVVESNQPLYLEAFQSAIHGKPFFVQSLTGNEKFSNWFEYKMQPVYDDDNVLLGVTLSAKDITIEKEAQLSIDDLTEKLKAVLESTDVSITLLDLDYKILAINEVAAITAEQNTNLEAYVGRDFRDLVPDRSNMFYEYYPRAVKGEDCSVEISYVNTRNEDIWYQTKFNPVYDQKRQQMGVSIFAKDITDKKNLEISLQASEERFRKITNIAPVGILITNRDYAIDYANLFAKNMLGYQRDELNNLSITQVIENFDISNENKLLIDNLDMDIETPIFQQEQFVGVTKSGGHINVLLSSSSFFTPKGIFYVFIIQDITDINNKENIIAEQNTKLRNIAWYQSHIIRAPLARILGVIDLMQNHSLDEKEKAYLYQAIVDSSMELDRVIHDIVGRTK